MVQHGCVFSRGETLLFKLDLYLAVDIMFPKGLLNKGNKIGFDDDHRGIAVYIIHLVR